MIAAIVVLAVMIGAVRTFSGPSSSPGARDEGSPIAVGSRFPWEVEPPPRSLVPLEEIAPGGPPPDGIPPIDEPVLIGIGEVDWIADREPVIELVLADEARAYPLQILTWHEIVNDRVGDVPITVTFCPLCNSAVAFDRRVDDRTLDFGTSGRLYRSNLVMYDRQTKSLWIQFTGQAVTGTFIGTELRKIPVQIVSWDRFRRAHPDGLVLSRDTGNERDYGRNPYAGYDDVNSSPFLYDGPQDERLRPMERVVTMTEGGDAVAVTLRSLREDAREGASTRSLEVGELPVVVLFETGTLSALDETVIADSKDIGATGVFDARIDGTALTLTARDGAFVDDRTGSTWDIGGRAIAGPLAGRRLDPVVHDDAFWFVWAAFRPDTHIVGAS